MFDIKYTGLEEEKEEGEDPTVLYRNIVKVQIVLTSRNDKRNIDLPFYFVQVCNPSLPNFLTYGLNRHVYAKFLKNLWIQSKYEKIANRKWFSLLENLLSYVDQKMFPIRQRRV